jgi:hypothetical protein
MPSEAEFDCVVMRLEESIADIGDSVVDPVVDQEDGRTVGYVAERSSYNYQVVGDVDQEFFKITFPYSLVNQLSGLMDERNARAVLAASGQSDDEDDEETEPAAIQTEESPDELSRRAALETLNNVTEENREAFVYHLLIILSSGSAAYSVQSTETGMVSGFTISTNMFPYGEGFGLREFDRDVQSVVNTGIGGLTFINRSFDFQSMIDAPELTNILPRYIH